MIEKIKEIEKRFYSFCDALILGVSVVYDYEKNTAIVEISISTRQYLDDDDPGSMVKVKLKFSGVEEFQHKYQIRMIYGSLFLTKNNLYVIDFFPDIGSEELLYENMDSECKIKFRAVDYTIIEE